MGSALTDGPCFLICGTIEAAARHPRPAFLEDDKDRPSFTVAQEAKNTKSSGSIRADGNTSMRQGLGYS